MTYKNLCDNLLPNKYININSLISQYSSSIPDVKFASNNIILV